jgi:hypothetical protein
MNRQFSKTKLPFRIINEPLDPAAVDADIEIIEAQINGRHRVSHERGRFPGQAEKRLKLENWRGKIYHHNPGGTRIMTPAIGTIDISHNLRLHRKSYRAGVTLDVRRVQKISSPRQTQFVIASTTLRQTAPDRPTQESPGHCDGNVGHEARSHHRGFPQCRRCS